MSTPNFQYANYMRLRANFADFQLEFFNKISDEKGEHLADLSSPTIIAMSPQNAKVLVNVLIEGIKDYESSYGEINAVKTNLVVDNEQ